MFIRENINGKKIAYLVFVYLDYLLEIFYNFKVGIVSSGSGRPSCAMLNHPGLYIRVKKYISWIKKTVKGGNCNEFKGRFRNTSMRSKMKCTKKCKKKRKCRTKFCNPKIDGNESI